MRIRLGISGMIVLAMAATAAGCGAADDTDTTQVAESELTVTCGELTEAARLGQFSSGNTGSATMTADTSAKVRGSASIHATVHAPFAWVSPGARAPRRASTCHVSIS
jgi:hypothetical protein